MEQPKEEAGRHRCRPATDAFLKANTASHHTSDAEPFYRYAAGLGSRRAAADKSQPLANGRRDPWHYPTPGACGYPEAAMHLLERGLLPAPNREGLAAMRDRKAAERITQAWELVVA